MAPSASTSTHFGIVLLCVNRANFLTLELTPYPHLIAYLERVSQRLRVQDASRAEGLVK